jgi:hypothetical protein
MPGIRMNRTEGHGGVSTLGAAQSHLSEVAGV